MEYYVYHEGRQVGPLSLSELTHGLANHHFSQSDHVWHEGLNHSKPLSDLFRSQSRIAPPPPQPQNPERQMPPPLPEQQGENRVVTPAEVMEKIRAFAQREYPDDYSMQKYTIEEQSESFFAIKRLDASNIPAGVFNEICQRAAIEYPDDYSMQKYEIEEEVEAYRHLHFD
jgi:hypothetical protein